MRVHSAIGRVRMGTFSTTDGDPVFYTAFGDCAYNLGMQCIQSYHRPFGAGAPLTAKQNHCNRVMQSARMVIEKNYSQMDNIFCICGVSDNYQLAKRNPYAIEQYRVCIFLTNCYICFNGIQAGSVNTFGICAPTIDEYLLL